MKKIIWFGVIFFGAMTTCFAENLNYRTNMLMDYEYQVENQSYIFQTYENNENNCFIFTTIPVEMPSYETDYNKISFNESQLNLKNFEKIKRYMWITQTEEDFLTRLNYYMGTQLLIWQYFHPEIDVQMEGKEEKIKVLEQMNFTPDWVHDYKMEEELRIEKQPGYNLTSDTCEIKEEEDWIISNCRENATIEVKENLEDETLVYFDEDKIELLEAGLSPLQWVINITVLEKEIIDTPITTPTEEEDKKEESPEEPKEEIKEEENKKEESPEDLKEEIKEEKEESKADEIVTELPKEEQKPIEENIDNMKNEGIEESVPTIEEKTSTDKEAPNKIQVDNVPNTEENRSIAPFILILIILIITKWKKLKLA